MGPVLTLLYSFYYFLLFFSTFSRHPGFLAPVNSLCDIHINVFSYHSDLDSSSVQYIYHLPDIYILVVAQSLDTQNTLMSRSYLIWKQNQPPLGCAKSIMAVNTVVLEFHLARMWLPKPLNCMIHYPRALRVDFIDSTQWSGHIIGICLASSLSLIGQEWERAPLIISST